MNKENKNQQQYDEAIFEYDDDNIPEIDTQVIEEGGDDRPRRDGPGGE